ncbi:hypothetical protein LY78DRAFT_708374 [Colletotrichum sublineola]|nr:hypothetical protein LY78DRAFT_708374 [Colletotrichum sublineola]
MSISESHLEHQSSYPPRTPIASDSLTDHLTTGGEAYHRSYLAALIAIASSSGGPDWRNLLLALLYTIVLTVIFSHRGLAMWSQTSLYRFCDDWWLYWIAKPAQRRGV